MKLIRSKIKYFILFVLTFFLLIGIGFRSIIPDQIAGFFKPVSVISQVVTDTKLKSDDGRINILVLGIDSRTGVSKVGVPALTDTIMVVSIDENGKKPVLISVPRDLWVPEIPSKINSVYPLVLSSEKRKTDDVSLANKSAIESTISAVQEVVGIPIHYYVIVGFDVFKDAVDSVGGIKINIDKSFDDDLYPIEGMEAAPNESDRYLNVHFDAGTQVLNGEMALKFARSRHSTNIDEQGDFARARRQQKVIEALKGTILSSKTFLNPIKLKDLYSSYTQNIQTDISLPDMLLFYKFSDLQIGNISQIVLSNEKEDPNMFGSGTLIAPLIEEREQKFNGQYVLVPGDRTYDNIHALIRNVLFTD